MQSKLFFEVKQMAKHLKVIGVDPYNQCVTGEVSKTLNSIACDSDHVPCVLIVKENENDIN